MSVMTLAVSVMTVRADAICGLLGRPWPFASCLGQCTATVSLTHRHSQHSSQESQTNILPLFHAGAELWLPMTTFETRPLLSLF